MQLDRIPPRVSDPNLDGTTNPVSGVEPCEASALQPVARPGRSVWLMGAVLVAVYALLGQGESTQVDARFQSPGAALATYWEALRTNDLDMLGECYAEPNAAYPLPGMVWFLPPVRRLGLYQTHVVPIGDGRVTAAYEVRFQPIGLDEPQHFITTTDLVQIHHEWHVVTPSGETGMPAWRPYPRSVDI